MGLVHGIRRLMEWGWFWSGCPLVVLIAAPALVLHTREIAGPFLYYSDYSGVRKTWYWLSGQVDWPIPTGLISPPPRFQIHVEPGCFDIYPPGNAHECTAALHYGECYSWYSWRPSVFARGIWAKTRTDYILSIPTNYNAQPNRSMSPVDFESVMGSLADSYEDWCFQRNWRIDQILSDQLKQGRAKWSEPIYAGYAHNALALFLLGMTGRGVFGSRRWWRAFKARFRSEKNCCVACGYDLRGLTRGRCPECGVLIPDAHTEIYTEREQIPGIESGVFKAVGGTAAAGGGGHEADEDADGAGGDEPEPRC